MSRRKNATPTSPESQHDDHATYLALTARLTAFQSELSTQAKSRAANEAPGPTRDMAAELIAQMARLMGRTVEARGLPRLPTDRPVTVSELSIAFAQTQHAFAAFGKRNGYDKPVADAEQERWHKEARDELARMVNKRIAMGIRTGYLIPTGGEFDEEKGELTRQFMEIVKRIGLIVDEEAMPGPDEKWF